MSVLVVVLLAMLSWLARRPTDAGDDQGARRVLASALAASGPAATTDANAAIAGVPASAAGGAQGDDEVELCGGHWFKLNADGSADTAEFERVIGLADARAALLAALRADPSDYAHAVAIRLALTGPPLDPEGVDALAKMASTTVDPRLYALAYMTCAGAAGHPGACQLLNAAQWARIDPNNSAPWLAGLAEATAREDVAAQDEALHRIATSTRDDDRFLGMTQQVLALLPKDDASLPATLALTVDAAGVDATQMLPPYVSLSRACGDAALSDANRRQTCGEVAELLFTQADTLIAHRTGAAIGKRLGWAPTRIEQARGESAAYFESLLAKGPDAARGSCGDMRRDLEAFSVRARLGEMGAVNDWVAHSGLAPADFLQIERNAQAQRAAAAASAAPATSP